MEDRCILCGDIIPEGRMVCPLCEDDPSRLHKKKDKKKNKFFVVVANIFKKLVRRKCREQVS